MLCMLQLAHPPVTSRVTVPSLKNVSFTVLYPDPTLVGKLSWLLWDLLLALFRATCLKEKKKANCATWKPFHSAVPAALAQGSEGTGEAEGRGTLSTSPVATRPHVRMQGAPPQARGTGAASIQALLPRQTAS